MSPKSHTPEPDPHQVFAAKIARRAADTPLPETPALDAPAPSTDDLQAILSRLRPAVVDLSNLTDCAAAAERMLMTWMRAQEAVSQVCPDLKLLNDSIATLKNLTSIRKSLIRLTCIAEFLSRPGSPNPASHFNAIKQAAPPLADHPACTPSVSVRVSPCPSVQIQAAPE